MPDAVADRSRATPLDDVEGLPARLGAMVGSVVRANRYLAWSAAERGQAEFLLIRETRVDTRVYLAASESHVVFFFRRPATEEVILDAQIAFTVRPTLVEPVAVPRRIRAILPKFFGGAIPDEKRLLLAKALGEKDPRKIIFVHLGLFYLALTDVTEIELAKASFMWHGDAAATVVLQRIEAAGSAVKIRYVPVPFLILLEEVARWAKDRHQAGPAVDLAVNPHSPEAVPRILNALWGAWQTSATEAGRRPDPDPFEAFLPDFAIADYRADVTLRLRPDGHLAERKVDDRFRLNLELDQRDGELYLTTGVPDFLVEGQLHDQLMELVRDPAAVGVLFRMSRLEKRRRAAFETFLERAETLVFRAEKDGDDDTEVFVFRGEWDGETKALAASLGVQVIRRGDDFEVKGKAAEVQLVFHNLMADPPDPRIEFPRYLLALVRQLHHWKEAFE
jgi:hypothetical protein